MKAAIIGTIGFLGSLGHAAAEPLVEGQVRAASGSPLSGPQVRLFNLADLRSAPVAAIECLPLASGNSWTSRSRVFDGYRATTSSGDSNGKSGRILRKLMVGTLGGGLGVASLPWIGLAWREKECGVVCLPPYSVFTVPVGYVMGITVGVSWIDPHDRFWPTLGGSAGGMVGGILLTAGLVAGGDSVDAGPAAFAVCTVFVGPVIMATIMSEWSRDPSEGGRLSFGLSPAPERGWLAAAVLRL